MHQSLTWRKPIALGSILVLVLAACGSSTTPTGAASAPAASAPAA